MNSHDFTLPTPFDAHRGARLHRFMESSDVNAAFRALFRPLRANVRHGMTIAGQIYALEMDECIPGQLLGTEWIPPSVHGIDDPELLADPARRQALFDRLLAARRPEALFAYVCEREGAPGPSLLYVELVSADGCYVAEYPLWPARGFRRRDLMKAPHRRFDRAVNA